MVISTAVDLFSGCGGLTTGLKQGGFEVRGAIEMDPLAVETYRMNHPEVRVWEHDIRAVDPDVFARELALNDVAIVAGCPPCEGFSRLRTRNGHLAVDDPRNDLICDWLRFVEVLRPQAVMLENVPELVEDRRFTEALAHLSEWGYQIDWAVLDAADFGVPQRRKRLILLGSKRRKPSFPKPETERVRVRHALADLPPAGRSGDPPHDRLMRNGPRIQDLIRSIPPDGGSRTDLPDEAQLECHKRFDGFKDVYGRMSWDEVAPTITGGCASPSKGRFLHPEFHRVITIREAALLQSFPRDYRISMRRGRYAAAEMIGNALPPAMIYRIAAALRETLEADGDENG
jgi:DNA (cytosine-5)-methyltransferase 1